jgi:hypothetical protein
MTSAWKFKSSSGNIMKASLRERERERERERQRERDRERETDLASSAVAELEIPYSKTPSHRL